MTKKQFLIDKKAEKDSFLTELAYLCRNEEK